MTVAPGSAALLDIEDLASNRGSELLRGGAAGRKQQQRGDCHAGIQLRSSHPHPPSYPDALHSTRYRSPSLELAMWLPSRTL